MLTARLEMIADHAEARKLPSREGDVPYRPLPPGLLYLDREAWDAMLAGFPMLAFSPFARPDGAEGHDAGGRPGIMFARSLPPGSRETVFTVLGDQARAWAGAEAPHAGHRLDPWLARAHRHPAARPQVAGGGGGDLARGTPAEAGHHRVADPATRARLRGRRLRTGVRAGPAGRAHLAPAAASQARRPVHRRGDRDRRGRPRGAPGLRHRPL